MLSLLAYFPGVVFATDRGGAFTLFHGQGAGLATLSSSAGLIGQSACEVFKGHPTLLYSIEQALAGQPATATVGFGNVVMEFWCGPYREASGDIVGMVGTAVDITRRLKTGETLRQTKEMLEAVVRSSPLGIAVLDPDSNVRLWNPAVEQIYGWTRDEVLGRRLRVIPQDHADDDLRTQQEVFAQGGITDRERLGLRKDGSVVPISLSGAPLHNAAGDVTGAMYVVMDLTERKRVEEALREAKVRAEAANRAKSEFLANMSHEIRTPMNAVLGMLQLVLDTALSPEQEHYLTVARGAAESLMRVLNDILDFSRIEARELSLAHVGFDVRTVLGETAETMALQAHTKGLELTCQVAPRIPALLNGDPLRLRQVLTNLLANAIKFTYTGEIGIVAGVESEGDRSATLRFQVTDTGIGVLPEKAAVLFDPFVQGDGSATRKFGGTGLGLALSRRLIEMMGGEIGVDSEPGRGSTFWFTAVFGKTARQPEHQAVPTPALDSLKVLVVDDSGANRTLVGAVLKAWGGCCHHACEGLSALAALRQAKEAGDPFRLAVVDMSLPGMTGEELGRQIASDRDLQETALALMTYPGQRFDPVRLRQIGFAAYVWKPVLQPGLAAAVMDALSLSNPGEISGPATHPLAGVPWQNRKRILIVEDDSASMEVALAMTQKLGYDADPVKNGAEALTALENVIYDGVLMDCEMPEMGGCETVARVRGWKADAHNATIPIIALTAHARQSDRDRCLHAGMNDYLSKPVELDELARTLSRWLGSPGNNAEPRPPASPALSDCTPVFDGEALLQRIGGSRELADRVIGRFVEETPRRLEQLKRRIDDCDGCGTRAHAHALRSASATVSAVSFCALATAVEEAGVRCEFKYAAGLLPGMEEQFRQFKLAVQERG
ncbi:putative Histidine kinase [Candidatus Sulfopaludibacter sp. SbA3]|nr:putative Histidine kinase [Candidatus Sulfopaludibacter sp. SbA3]